MDDLFIDYLISKMSLKEKIGQLLYIDYRKTNEKIIGMTNDFEKILNEYKPGGFILFNSNISDFNNTKKFIKDIQSINENNMFIGIDQEGGSVQRLGSNVGFEKIPAASLINDKEEAYLLGKEVGMELFSIGVNMNMAPVMDIWSNIKNIVMMNRTYGSDPYEVSEKALSFAKGLKEVKIIPVVKHFPGHGSTNVNSHIDLPISYKTKEELYNCMSENIEKNRNICYNTLATQLHIDITMYKCVFFSYRKNTCSFQHTCIWWSNCVAAIGACIFSA